MFDKVDNVPWLNQSRASVVVLASCGGFVAIIGSTFIALELPDHTGDRFILGAVGPLVLGLTVVTLWATFRVFRAQKDERTEARGIDA
jgi:hypothetical protein